MKSLLLFFAIHLFASHGSCADLKFAALFSDHTVLQRDVAVPVWGWADPGEQVTVTFQKQQKSVTADAVGKWLVKLDPMPASTEGHELSVQSALGRSSLGNRESKITDVVVGDVWLCSGQSNMHFQMKSTENASAEIAAANNTAVRFFTVEHQFLQKPSDQASGTWRPISPTSAADCSAVAYYFAAALQPKIGVPVGLIVSSVGGTRIETWMRSETLAATVEGTALVEKWAKVSPEEFEKIGSVYRDYQHQRDQVHPQTVKAAKASGMPIPPEPKMPKLRCHDSPSSLHNGMIAPLEPFALRGAVWYQGESNSGQPAAYEKLLPAMITDWRRVWGEKLPFLFVQLAPHRSIHPSFRESQTRIWQNTPHTAMAVTTDVGNAQNIHPTRKQPVGERLALAARAMVYGEQIESSGPVFKAMQIEGKRAIVRFSHLGSGLMVKGDTLKGFSMAGTDSNYLPAHAIVEGETVVVTSDKVADPKSVRFGWAQVPEVNLFNREGLPAVPFTSR